MKRGMLCLLLLSGCWASDDPPPTYVYELTWKCRSPEGCERTEEVARIDRVKTTGSDWRFMRTQDETFAADAEHVISAALPLGCEWLYFLSLFGHELDRSVVCRGPGGFNLELAIPNADPTTFSMWLVEGRDPDLF